MSSLERRVDALESRMGVDTEGAAHQYIADLLLAVREKRPVPERPWPAGASKAFADLVIAAWRKGDNEQLDETC